MRQRGACPRQDGQERTELARRGGGRGGGARESGQKRNKDGVRENNRG